VTLLIINDSNLFDLIKKGEIVTNYFNPKNIFQQIVFVNFYKENKKFKKEFWAGKAKIKICPFFIPRVLKTLFYLFFPKLSFKIIAYLVKNKIKTLKINQIKMIRCYGHGFSLQIGVELKNSFKVPLLVSLHGNPDVDYLRGRRAGGNPLLQFIGKRQQHNEEQAIAEADFVFGVYEPIRPYLEKTIPSRHAIISNLLSKNIPAKKTYESKKTFKILNVGRQEPLQKNPLIILKAVCSLPNVHATLIGNGSLHNQIKKFVIRKKIKNRVSLIPAMKNSEIMNSLAKFDLFVYQSDNWEISKTCMEASLCGLPVIVNQRKGGLAKEICDAGFYVAKNTPEGFKRAIKKFSQKPGLRAKLGNTLRKFARKNWDPNKIEQAQANIIKKVIANRV